MCAERMKAWESHMGEVVARERLGSAYDWDEASLRAMFRPTMSRVCREFIANVRFFFIATSDSGGNCDASFRGSESDAQGRPCPALAVLDERRLIFPDYPGNGLYTSLGNILENPHIGMLFVDFSGQRRMRINGSARLCGLTMENAALWPKAQAGVLVTVEQTFVNCSARIPRLIPL